MTTTPHARYEELAVGYALSALEPEDEQEFVRHLASCAQCERDLDVHRETLAHLAYAADAGTPPAGLWDAIRSDVERESGAAAFGEPVPAAPVADLGAARARRTARLGTRRAAAWTSVAAAMALVVGLGYGVVTTQQDRNRQSAVAARLDAAVQAIETAPSTTVPLKNRDGSLRAVAVVQGQSVSLIVDGLSRNDRDSSVYVLWGQSGTAPAYALTTFDVTQDDAPAVVRDVALTGSPELYVITKEPGRTAPAETRQPALATGRTA